MAPGGVPRWRTASSGRCAPPTSWPTGASPARAARLRAVGRDRAELEADRGAGGLPPSAPGAGVPREWVERGADGRRGALSAVAEAWLQRARRRSPLDDADRGVRGRAAAAQVARHRAS